MSPSSDKPAIRITPSHIIEYLYCPRFTWFEYVLAIPQYEEKHYKVMRGRHMHNEKLERNKGYLRRRIGAVEKWTDQYLAAGPLRGRIDEVLKLKDGSFAPLDYKFAEWKGKIYRTHRIQLYCYALMIEKNFKAKVKRGYLVYIRSKNKLIEVEVPETAKRSVEESIASIDEIIERNYYPKATKYKSRCLNCTYRNICIR